MPYANRFIKPHILAALSGLHLVAKSVVDGFMLGIHSGSKPGAGLEFNQYRSYQPGDDLRYLDWKTYARSDRFFIREAELETSIHLHFLLDASLSMAHRDENGMTKIDYGRFLIASLAYLALNQGDAVGLHGMGGKRTEDLPASRHRRHFFRFLRTLEAVDTGGRWPDWERASSVIGGRGRKDLVIVVTDLYQHGDEIARTLTRLAGMKHEVLVFHLLGRNEMTLPYRGPVTFVDLETREKIEVVPEAIGERYALNMSRHRERWCSAMNDARIAHEELVLDQPLDLALRAFLSKRAKLI